MSGKSYLLAELAEKVQASSCLSDGTTITGLASLQSAREGDISFLSKAKFLDDLLNCKASAVLITEEFADRCPVKAVIVESPYLAYAKLSELFVAEHVNIAQGIHPSAVVAQSAKIESSASISAGVVIADNVTIGAGVQLHPGVVVSAGASIAAGSVLYPNVTIYHDVEIGQNCIIHANTVIGSDGFGFAPNKNHSWQKIHQLGSVIIGDRVEIGSGCTIDRGALGDTVIEDSVIIDDQVHIAHNCLIGANTGIAGATAIAGSTSIGKNCTIAGAVGIVGHLEIADNVHITAMSLVTHSITQPGAYSSGTAMSETKSWRKNAVRFNQLDDMARRLKKLEKQLNSLISKNSD